MQQNFAEVEQPAQTLPVRNLTETHPPPLALQPHKQRVNRRKYAIRRIQVLLLKTGGYGFMILALVVAAWSAMFVCLVAGMSVWEHFFPNHDSQWNVPLWQCALNVVTLLAPFALGACVCYGVGRLAKKRAVHLESSPLINVATADLPAAESLVRASEEPRQAYEALLLRGATAGQERHEEQLLRAAAGQEQN